MFYFPTSEYVYLKMKFKQIILMFVVVCLIKYSDGNLGCRDENGEFIDWIYMTKLPTEKNSPNNEPENGLDFYFLKPNSVEWIRSNVKINSNESIPGLLLSEIYTTKVLSDSIVLLYNDEPPTGKPDGVDGHSKGVVAADFQSGFWLIHSVPKFPPNLEVGYNFPETGQRFGQSFLCISFKADQMDLVGKQILYNEPYVYSSSVPDILSVKYPNLVKASEMVKIKEAPFWSVQNLTSVGGTRFRSFAKNRKFGKELYADWVAPDLQTDLEVETWLNGPGKIASNCSRREQ